MTVAAKLRGVPAAPGVALGPWTRIAGREAPTDSRGVASAAEELERLQCAARDVSAELADLATKMSDEGHADEAGIFIAHSVMAVDTTLLEAAARLIEDSGLDAGGAVLAASTTLATEIAALDDELLSQRAADVRDVGDRIARALAGINEEDLLPAPAIVVADDLAPSLTATLPRERILGICLEGSSATAHAAILSRAYGIPAVVGVRGLLAALDAARPNSELALDGRTGEVVLDPGDADRSRFRALAAVARGNIDRALIEAALPAETRDGTSVTLLANIGTPREAAGAFALGARGVGLFRTEFLFLERSSAPSEDEQAAAYRAVVDEFSGFPITIRLLDVGGDKPIPYLRLPREDNPFLGVRALRLADRYPEIFRTQLRAAYRAAAAGPVKVMAPMVADASDADLFLSLAAEARTSLDREGIERGEVSLGAMVEIPSAVLTADAYFGELQFASLGTNDLLQYTLAADRGNAALERYRDSLHPALLELVRGAVSAAKRAGIELSVCGEMAGEPVAALALAALGIRQLSMAPASLAAVRRAIRDADVQILSETSERARRDRSAAEVRARFASLLGSE